MISDMRAPRMSWSGKRFWLTHLALPLLVAVLLLTTLELTNVDLWLADRWFAMEGGQWAWRLPMSYLLTSVAVGWTFALGQEARGAHFPSHDLWSLSLCWFGALGLFLLFRPGHWPHPIRSLASLLPPPAEGRCANADCAAATGKLTCD